jgi:hypothetical protein
LKESKLSKKREREREREREKREKDFTNERIDL